MKRLVRKLPGGILRVFAFIGLLGMVLGAVAVSVSPNSAQYLAFFGLGYPVWFFLAVLGLVYSLLRRRWFLLVAIIAVFIIQADFIERTVRIRAFSREQEKAKNTHRVSVMTYNVRIFDLYNWSEGSATRDKIFDFLDEHRVDVLCFQEFYHTDRKGIFDTKDTLVQFLDNVHVHERYTHEMTGKQYFGVATFSKHPIVESGDLAFESDANNFCIYTDILVDGDTLRVYNAHLASIRFQQEDYEAMEQGLDPEDAKRLADRLTRAFRKRASQAEKIAAHIASSPHPVVVCGDFNDTPVSYAYELFASHLEDAFVSGGNGLGSTYIGSLPFFRIDYVMHSRGMRVEHFETHEVRHSDHRPVEAHLSW